MSERDPQTTAPPAWSRTFRAIAKVTPVHHLGSYEDCSAWCQTMIGREVWVTDADGKQQVIGVITKTKSENADGF